MTIFGLLFTQISSVVLLVIVIALTKRLSGTAATFAGLLVTTIVGFITVAGSLLALRGLPSVRARQGSLKPGWHGPSVEFIPPLRDMPARRNMTMLLVAYTTYTDTLFAIASVSGQLYVAEIKPGALEYSLYSLAQVLFIMVCQVLFLWIRPHLPISLETWLIVGYGLSLVMPVWGLIGLADVDFGWKMRWEFYVMLFVSQTSQAFANTAWEVLFSEVIPVGSEMRWLTLQVVLCCGTIRFTYHGLLTAYADSFGQVWVNYVVSAPLQNATHELRFPLLNNLIFLICPIAMEVARIKMRVFREDRRKWQVADGEVNSGTETGQESVVAKTKQ